MPFVENQGAKIYWDEQGQGEPILLIMGLGYSSCLWHRTRPVLAQRYRTVAFDNRGVGLSDAPPGPYSQTPYSHTGRSRPWTNRHLRRGRFSAARAQLACQRECGWRWARRSGGAWAVARRTRSMSR